MGKEHYEAIDGWRVSAAIEIVLVSLIATVVFYYIWDDNIVTVIIVISGTILFAVMVQKRFVQLVKRLKI